MLEPQVFADHETVSQRAAEWMAARIRRRPDALFCLATGATPMRSYELLVAERQTEPRLFDRWRVLNLDEWGGLKPDDPASCEGSLRGTVIEPLGTDDRFVRLQGDAEYPQAECDRVAAWLAANGPIDACVLGLGLNGHLGFNEPAQELRPHCHVADLAQASLGHAMLGKRIDRPMYGMTLGMADVMHSREVLLVVTGRSKGEAMAKLLSGGVTTSFPATLLHLHPHATLMCDEAAWPSG